MSSVPRCAHLELSSADREQVKGQSEGANGMPTGEDGGQRRDDHDDVRNTADCDTPADHLESTVLGVSQPAEEDRQSIGQKLEGLGHGRGHNRALAQSTGSVLGAGLGRARAVSVGRERCTDKVLVHLVAAIVGRTLSKLDGAQIVAGYGHLPGYASQCALLLLGGEDEAVVGGIILDKMGGIKRGVARDVHNILGRPGLADDTANRGPDCGDGGRSI